MKDAKDALEKEQKKVKGFLKEFKDFAVKGNVIDMAVGVIIGGAFGKIVTSLVNDIVMPALSLLTGKINLSALSYQFPAVREGLEPVVIRYGSFLQNVLDFFIIALCIFLFVRTMTKTQKKLSKKEEETPAAPPAPTKEEVLLTEIRDLLKEQSKERTTV